MTKVGHVITGTSGALFTGLDPFLSILGSVAPDKDILIAKLFGTWNTNRKKTLLTAHRGITHHLFLLILSSALILYFGKTFPYGYFISSFCLGYALHLIGDMLTPLGIPYTFGYYPRLAVPLFRTNSVSELIAVGTLAVVSGFSVVKNPHLLLDPVTYYLDLLRLLLQAPLSP